MEPNQQFQNTENADNIRKEMEQAQKQARQQQAAKMDQVLDKVASSMTDEEKDIRDDGRRHEDLKTSLKVLQQQISQLLQN